MDKATRNLCDLLRRQINAAWDSDNPARRVYKKKKYVKPELLEFEELGERVYTMFFKGDIS